MKAGKLAPDKLQALVLGRFAHRRRDVLVPARVGEDCAVIDFGAEVCVMSTDPITGAASGAGRLAVHVSCNDVAANGATPIGVQVVLLLPEDTPESDIAKLMDEVESGCRELDIEVLGGHTEITTRVASPVIVTTAIGRAARDKYVTSSGCRPGDAVVVTKGLGMEGSAILAADWAEAIKKGAVAQALPACRSDEQMEQLLQTARSFSMELSAVRAGVAAADFGVSAMHDITEGGLYGGLYEMGRASGVSFRILADQTPVYPATAFICSALQLDPLCLISSGSMLIACADGPGLVAHLSKAGVPAAIIGTAVHPNTNSVLVTANGEQTPLPVPTEDELWRFLSSV